MSYPHDFVRRWFPGEDASAGFHRLLVAQLPAAGKLLDLGCGSHELLNHYRTPEREAWGADITAHPQLQHPQWYRPLEVDGAIPFADQTFDLVCSHMVMEHVPEPARFFGEIARVLRPGGVYVGHSIHGLHYVTWIRRLLDVLPHNWVQRLVKTLYGREEHDTFPTHYRLNSQRAIDAAARDAGLEPVQWDGYANQGYFAFSPLAVRLAVILDWCLNRCCTGLGEIYFTTVLRKPARSVPGQINHEKPIAA